MPSLHFFKTHLEHGLYNPARPLDSFQIDRFLNRLIRMPLKRNFKSRPENSSGMLDLKIASIS
jgi:hypothetical protein